MREVSTNMIHERQINLEHTIPGARFIPNHKGGACAPRAWPPGYGPGLGAQLSMRIHFSTPAYVQGE